MEEEMNYLELDRLLCERLGIEPKREWFRIENAGGSWGESKIDLSYPALSTTGDGMVRLMKELRYQNHEVVIEYLPTGPLMEGLCCVRVGAATWKGCLPAPLSLALTAAAALGIEVPE